MNFSEFKYLYKIFASFSAYKYSKDVDIFVNNIIKYGKFDFYDNYFCYFSLYDNNKNEYIGYKIRFVEPNDDIFIWNYTLSKCYYYNLTYTSTYLLYEKLIPSKFTQYKFFKWFNKNYYIENNDPLKKLKEINKKCLTN